MVLEELFATSKCFDKISKALPKASKLIEILKAEKFKGGEIVGGFKLVEWSVGDK